ncbi:MAG: anti-sigma factor family protein [Longimicrobiales bacterium]
MHLDDERIQRLLHGELTPSDETFARAHAARCPDCRERVASAERVEMDMAALLRHLDHAPPRVSAHALALSASTSRYHWARWAAGIVLAFGVAGAAYALPGSPIPQWVSSVIDRAGTSSDARVVPTDPATAQEDDFVAGIAVAPGQALVILFASTQALGSANVSLSDGDQVEVRALNGAAKFTSEEDPDRLSIDNTGSSASYEILIPREAPRVEIRVAGRRVFLKEGSRMTSTPNTDARLPYTIPLTPAGS